MDLGLCLFVSGINQGNEEERIVQDLFVLPQGGALSVGEGGGGRVKHYRWVRGGGVGQKVLFRTS